MSLVHETQHSTGLSHLVLARIFPASSDCAFEETSATIACEDTVMFARAKVTAHLTRDVIQDPA